MSDRSGMPASYDEDISREPMSEPEGMDRGKNNQRLRELVQSHRHTRDGTIPVPDVEPMITELTALLDELIDAAYTAGAAESGG